MIITLDYGDSKFEWNVEGAVERVSNPRIAIYSCPLDTTYSETKATVLIQNANELLNYSKGE